MRNSFALVAAGLWVCGPSLAGDRATATDGLASVDRVDVCFRHGCAERRSIRLTADEMHAIVTGFRYPAPDAASERAAIARSVALLERIVGALTGTDRDLGGTFPGAFRPGQMDCIDESNNTTGYLNLLASHGLLRWHSIEKPATRLPIPHSWWPHTSAVIRERDSGTAYAVDAWFEANGRPPHIVELKTWRRGWKPERDEAAK